MSFGAIVGIFTAIVALAGLGIVMTSANTSDIIKQTFDGFAGALKAATSKG